MMVGQVCKRETAKMRTYKEMLQKRRGEQIEKNKGRVNRERAMLLPGSWLMYGQRLIQL